MYIVLNWALQIDKDRAVAAGASYGGYAIKCVFGADLLESWLKMFLVGSRATLASASDSRLSFVMTEYMEFPDV